MTLWPPAGCKEAGFRKDLLRGSDLVQGFVGEGISNQGLCSGLDAIRSRATL